MSDSQNSFECRAVCWGVAAAVGIASIVMLYMFGGFDGNQAFFVGVFIALALGVVLSLFLCRGQRAAADLASSEKPAQRYAREAEERMAVRRSAATTKTVGDAAATSGTAPQPSHTETHAASAPLKVAETTTSTQQISGGVKPSTPLAGQAELAERKGSWKYEGNAVKADSKSEAIPAGDTAAPAVQPVETAANAEESKPELYTSAPAEGADDLKLISGVGPKLEQTLNELGIYRFEQVAAWGPQEIAWVDARLRFKGRIERDDWMSQAKTLAAGGETEFSKKKK